MSDYTNEAVEWLESHMDKHLAVIEVRLVKALLQHIDELRHTIEVLKADKYNADTEEFARARNKALDELVRQAQEDGEYDA